MVTDAQKLRDRYIRRMKSLGDVRATFDQHYKDLARFIAPWRSRFSSAESNQGGKKNQSIINNAASRAARILASGIHTGVTSEARKWFRLTTPDPSLAEHGAVKQWLSDVEDRVLAAMAKSNLYNVLPGRYYDLGVFGTAPMHVEEDTQDIIRAYPYTVGRYFLDVSDRLEVDTAFRERSMTVRQMVKKFGLKSCSKPVQREYAKGDYDCRHDVVQVVEPREEYDASQAGEKNLPIRSCWFEKNADTGTGILRESGYAEQPVIAPRWDVTDDDVYGHSPGMEALGDIKSLQTYERQKAKAVDKIVDPPMKGPASLRGRPASLIPGSITYLEDGANRAPFEPAVVIHPQAVTVASQAGLECRERVDASFFADLWLMMSEESEPQKTAREIAERHEEKLLQLGPVMGRLERELLSPLIARVFGILDRAGYLPPPPPELQGQDIRIQFISIMSQAQKMVEGSSAVQLVQLLTAIAPIKEDIVDKVDLDELVAQYNDALGLRPNLIVPEDQVQQTRQQRAQAQAQQAQAEQAAAMAKSAKDLSGADLGSDNALSRVVGGVAAAQAEGSGA